MRGFALMLVVVVLHAAGGPVRAAEPVDDGLVDVILVLDASGSMWGRVDDRPKIEIAREAIDALLQDDGAARSFGLMAYGHRRKGDCSDIELLVPPGAGDAATVQEAVAGVNPRGRTPLTEAVRQAARALRYRENAARVVLVSDGRETCNADPCAVGAELEAQGVGFTAHVIGFDVDGPEQAGLRCLAENTGGRFLAAARADELRSALGEVAGQLEEPARTVILKAVDRAGGPALRAEALRWTVTSVDGESVLDEAAQAVPRLNLEPGQYRAVVQLGEAEAESSFEVVAGRDAVHELELAFRARLEVPETVAAGSPFEVDWQGPDKKGDYVTVVPADAAEGEYREYAYTAEGSPLTLRAPDGAGAHEVRYLSGQSNTTLARAELKVSAVEARLRAPESGRAGDMIEVRWEGPDNEGDYVTIVPAGTSEGEYGNYAHTQDGSPLTLRVPDEAGDHELRYQTGQSGRTLARRPLTVRATEAGLDAPDVVEAGADFSVQWQGPDNDGDYVTIVPVGTPEGEYGNYAYTSDNPVDLRAPDAPGKHELRYQTGQSGRVLVRREITVEATPAT
ncbi:MAG: vWA domain-containing protein, partial [Pseudomonadota bacterium]